VAFLASVESAASSGSLLFCRFLLDYFRQLTQGKLADTHNKRALPAVFFICVPLPFGLFFIFDIFLWIGLVTNAYILVI
jgi:hypothetical protein